MHANDVYVFWIGHVQWPIFPGAKIGIASGDDEPAHSASGGALSVHSSAAAGQLASLASNCQLASVLALRGCQSSFTAMSIAPEAAVNTPEDIAATSSGTRGAESVVSYD